MKRLRLEIERHQESERNLSYLARHDPLTHLPNRMLANELKVLAGVQLAWGG